MDIEILDASSLGLIKDVKSHLLTPEAWSTVFNGRFSEGQIEWLGAKIPVFGTPAVPPYFAMMVRGGTGERFIFYWGQAQAYAINVNFIHTNITRGGGSPIYNGLRPSNYNSTVLGGIPIMNNGVDQPQYWSPVSITQDLQNLPNIPVDERAKVFRAFGPYLCAYNVTIGVDTFPHMVHWSHPADPGSVPVSWDESDPTRDAGKNDLSDTQNGVIVDAMTLRGQMYIYKESSTWIQRITGGRFVFSFDTFLETVGALAPRCVATTGDGKYHFVAGQDDIYIHDGATVTPLLTGRMKKAVFSNIDASNYDTSFVFAKPESNEMWFCYPENGALTPTRALIWNYGVKSELGTLSEAAVDFDAAAAVDLPADATAFWDADPGVWNNDTSVWDTVQKSKIITLRPLANKFLLLDSGSTNDGTPVNAMIQRTGLAVMGTRRGDEWVNDYAVVKFCKRVWLRASGSPFAVRLGTQDTVDGTVTWSSPMTFDPATMLYVDFLITGPVLAIEFSGTSAFQVQGYKMEIAAAGRLMPLFAA